MLYPEGIHVCEMCKFVTGKVCTSVLEIPVYGHM